MSFNDRILELANGKKMSYGDRDQNVKAIKITDKGLFDTNKFDFVEIFNKSEINV